MGRLEVEPRSLRMSDGMSWLSVVDRINVEFYWLSPILSLIRTASFYRFSGFWLVRI